MSHPDGACAGAASDRARRYLEVPPGHLELVIRPSAALNAAQRLELYQRSFSLRRLGAIRASYPALRQMLGPVLFDDFALEYLRAQPSRSYNLRRLADGFPDHLAATRADAVAVDETWPDMVIDLARLERVVAEVYDARGAEGEHILDSHALPPEPDARWLAARAEPVPCLRLVRSSFPTGPYVSAVWRGDEPPPPSPLESFLAVSRRDYVVTLVPLARAEHTLLARLLGGDRVGDAARRARLGESDTWHLVRDWADRGLLRSLCQRVAPSHRPPSRRDTPPSLKEPVTP